MAAKSNLTDLIMSPEQRYFSISNQIAEEVTTRVVSAELRAGIPEEYIEQTLIRLQSEHKQPMLCEAIKLASGFVSYQTTYEFGATIISDAITSELTLRGLRTERLRNPQLLLVTLEDYAIYNGSLARMLIEKHPVYIGRLDEHHPVEIDFEPIASFVASSEYFFGLIAEFDNSFKNQAEAKWTSFRRGVIEPTRVFLDKINRLSSHQISARIWLR